MLVLLGIGFLGGLITGISPCILPVLPVIVAGSSTDQNPRRPYAIIGGLIVSFSLLTLVGGSLLNLLHLPADFLRDLGIALLLILALGLIVHQLGQLLERPFARLGARRQSRSSSGVVLGMSLGLVFVPCAGPVLAAITTVAATHRIGLTSVLLTLAYAAGAAVPLLVFAVLAQRTTGGWKRWRDHTQLVRRLAGVVLGLTALAIAADLTGPLTAVPGYTSALEKRVEGTPSTLQQLAALRGLHPKPFVKGNMVSVGSLPDLGQAPQFTDIARWLNTLGDKPLTLSGLRGKVVLIDFWTYSCINCARTLPHVESWYKTYKHDGFVVVGVHTPEFAFEHVVSNVRTAAAQFGVLYPIAVDNDYGTWDAYANQYWPAEYLLDQSGNVRHVQFGEGDYAGTEGAIRLLLAAGGATHLPPATEVADRTPMGALTPESYLGYDKLANYVGSAVRNDQPAVYRIPSAVPADTLSFGGTWTLRPEEATAGRDAKLLLKFRASNIYLVLGGSGTVGVSANGTLLKTVSVSGVPDLYTLLSSHYQEGTLLLSFSPGVQAYAFTFG